MPPNSAPKAPSSVASSRHDVLGAPRYRCALGGEWKPPTGFSRKNFNALESKIARGQKVTPATTGMICREHTGEPRLERRCEGPCNQVKTLSEFSKSSLTNNAKWCQTCVRWKESQDDHQAGTEDSPGFGPAQPKNNTFSIPIEDDTDGESAIPTARSASLIAPSFSFLRPSESDVASGRLLGVASRDSGSLPPHLASLKAESDGGQGLSDVGLEELHYPDDESICPDDSASQLGGPNNRFLRPKPTTAKLTAAALNQKEGLSANGKPSEYLNSWDTSGRQHMQRRAGDSELGSTWSFDTRELSTVLSSEDRFSRDTASSVQRPEVPERNRKWAKMPRKTVPPPPIPEWTEDDVEFDDDGSEPELP